MKKLREALSVACESPGVALMLACFLGLGAIIAVQVLDLARRALFP